MDIVGEEAVGEVAAGQVVEEAALSIKRRSVSRMSMYIRRYKPENGCAESQSWSIA